MKKRSKSSIRQDDGRLEEGSGIWMTRGKETKEETRRKCCQVSNQKQRNIISQKWWSESLIWTTVWSSSVRRVSRFSGSSLVTHQNMFSTLQSVAACVCVYPFVLKVKTQVFSSLRWRRLSREGSKTTPKFESRPSQQLDVMLPTGRHSGVAETTLGLQV